MHRLLDRQPVVIGAGPLSSPTPASAAAIGQALVDRIKPMLDGVVEELVALHGNPAELESDALSVLATIGALVAQQMSRHLMLRRHVGLDVAFPIAMHEIHQRAASQLLAVVETRRNRAHR